MTKKQRRLLGLYRELDQICREKNVEYTLAGTTAAGAILAGGFLEGDETLNLYVTAKGWDVLRQVPAAELPPERAFLGTDMDDNDTSAVKRYAATDTCAVHKSDLPGSGRMGEGIRLILLDALPAGEEALEGYRKTLILYAEAADPSTVYGEGWELPAADYKKVLSACKARGRAKTLGEMEETLAANKDETCPLLISRLPESPLMFERGTIFPAEICKFEDIPAPVPGRVGAYMTELYGIEWACRDSWGQELAPEEISPAGVRPAEFREEYLPGIRVSRLTREQKKHKIHVLSHAPAVHRSREKALVQEAAPVLERLNERIRQGAKPAALADAGDYRTLEELLGDYLRLQTSTEYIGRKYLSDWYFYEHPVLLEVSEEIFAAGVRTLLYTGRAGDALRLLSIKKRASTLPLAPALEKMRTDLLRFKTLVQNDGNGDGIGALLKTWPKVPEFLELQAGFLMNQARLDHHTAETAVFLEDALRFYPESGCFRKYKGEILWMRGRCADALELFEEAVEKTDNRRIRHEIEIFLQQYGSRTAQTCRRLMEGGQKTEALRMAQQWAKLLPKDEEIRGVLFLARVSAARTVKEMDALVTEMTEKVEKSLNNPLAEPTEDLQIYRPALTRAWERLGFPAELASVETDILYSRDSDSLELLAVKARDSLIHKERLAEVGKVIGDAHRKQGQTVQAMEDYKKAMDSPGKSYVKAQLSRILEEQRQAETEKPQFREDAEFFSEAKMIYGSMAGAGAKEPEDGTQPDIAVKEPGNGIRPDIAARETGSGTRPDGSCGYLEECWVYVRFCGKRLALEQYYLSQKEYVENLNRNQDIPALVRVLGPYHQATLRCLKRQEIFVPDEEIFRIYLETLEKTGNKALKEKAERYW